MVIYCKVLAKEKDLFGYTTIVVQNLENAPFGYKYVMATICPNWESRVPEIGEVGYLEYSENRAGEDKWFDRVSNSFVPYNYNMIQFLKFILKKSDNSKDIII